LDNANGLILNAGFVAEPTPYPPVTDGSILVPYPPVTGGGAELFVESFDVELKADLFKDNPVPKLMAM
jgi:hypothetical protein